MEMDYTSMGNVAGTRLLSFFVLFVVFGALTRSAIKSFALSEGTSKHPMQDVVAAFEVYGCNIGHVYVFQIYGLGPHLIVLLIVGIYHAFFLNGFTANPITYVLQYLMNCCPPNVTITKILALVLGGLVGHVTAVVFWPVLMAEFDRQTLAEMHCLGVSTSTPVFVCPGVEFLGLILTCILVINITSSSVDAFEPPMKFLNTCLLSGAGLSVSNVQVYLNPVMASSRLIGCDGKDFFLHLVSYWIAPIGGAAVAVLFKEFTSHNSDFVCLPRCESKTSCLQSSKECAGLKDFNPDLPCLCNAYHQAARSSILVSNVRMPPICVSRAEEEEEVEDENRDDVEVIYGCAKYSDVGRVKALNCDELAHTNMRRRRCTEQTFSDACFRKFPRSNTTWPSGTVTSSKTYGIHYCTPISRAGQIPHIHRLLCSDLCTDSDMPVPYSCSGYRESLSCSCHGTAVPRPFCASVCYNSSTCDKTNARTPTLGEDDNMDSASSCLKYTNTTEAELLPASKKCLRPSSGLVPAQPECNNSEDQSRAVRIVPRYASCSRKTDIQHITKPTAAPTRLRSQRTSFKQPLRDHSQNQATDIDCNDELVAKPSVHKFQTVSIPHESTPQLDEEPCQDESMYRPPTTVSPQCPVVIPSQTPRPSSSCSSMVEPSQNPTASSPHCPMVGPSQTPQTSSSCSSMVGPSQIPQTSPSPSSMVGPSQSPPTSPSRTLRRNEVPKTPSHHVSRSHLPPKSQPSQQGPTDTHRKHSHKHRCKSSHKSRTDKHTKASQRCPSGRHQTSSHKDPHKSSHKNRNASPSARPTPSHNGPHKSTNACPTPSRNQRKLSPHYTSGARSRTPSCQRSRDAGFRRSSPTRSNPFPTDPESCFFELHARHTAAGS